MYEIEKGILQTGTNKYPWRKMEIGDSFFVPNGSSWQLCSMAIYQRKRTGRRYSCRQIKSEDGKLNGVRVWRVE